jgi:hypothetical protein
MNLKKKTIEDEIKQLLEETKAENDALKKMLTALMERDIREQMTKRDSEESSQHKTK